MASISLEGLTKRYGALTAVSNLTLAVEEGEILGFLGLNGAGKTTTIRLLLDLLRPSSGKASIFGHDCQSDGLRARAQIGYLPSEMGIYADLTGGQLLSLLDGLNPRPAKPAYVRELQERLQLPDADLRRKLREYSTGMKRKLGIIQAFQADPPLLILDEPTEGLDPLMQESFYNLLSDAQRRGRTVFFSSHVLTEVDRVCQRVALLRKGELVLLDSVEECRKRVARSVLVKFRDVAPAPRGLPPEVQIVETGPRFWRLKVLGPLGSLLRELASLPVDDIEVSEAKLEDAVLDYYRGDAA
ncbi:MAG: ABC transporter ATP-binding protein [Acidobacteriota bacterium]